jgi:hypothetical protein
VLCTQSLCCVENQPWVCWASTGISSSGSRISSTRAGALRSFSRPLRYVAAALLMPSLEAFGCSRCLTCILTHVSFIAHQGLQENSMPYKQSIPKQCICFQLFLKYCIQESLPIFSYKVFNDGLNRVNQNVSQYLKLGCFSSYCATLHNMCRSDL